MRFSWSCTPNRRSWLKSCGALLASIALAAVTLSSAGVSASPELNGQSPFHARHGHRIVLPGTLPRALADGRRMRREDGTRPLQLVIALRVQHPTELAALIVQQSDPKSAKYHKYLTPQGFADQFGPTPEIVTAVRTFLVGMGLKVSGVSANRILIDANGTVKQVERAFDITISRYQLGQRTVFAPDQEPSIPDSLATDVQAIVGLDNVGVYHPVGERERSRPARANSGPGGGFTPTDLRNAYDVGPLINAGGDGTSQRVGVFELAPYIPGDIAVFRGQYSLPGSALINHSVDGATVSCAAAGTLCDVSGVGEADLDIEIVSGLAPNVTQDIYTGPNSGAGVLDTYQAIATDNVDKAVTTSWGLCEPLTGATQLQALDNIFFQAASQGQTVFSAAGDYGSTDCVQSNGSTALAVLSPASDPYVVGVGGTTLTLSSGGGYASEITWNDYPPHNYRYATGGGNSAYFGRPSWQVGSNLPSNGVRLVPDVAANADPYTGYSVYCSSTVSSGSGGCNIPGYGTGWEYWGGTSAAAPLWAGMLADINRLLTANGRSYVGWVNSALYQLLGSAQFYSPFHDVTSGNNDLGYGSGGFAAGTCYDQVTGVGTPDAWNIALDFWYGVDTFGGGSCPIRTSTNLIADGGFETNPGPWQIFSQGGFLGIEPVNPHSGSNAFLACAYPSCDDRASQTITVPATVTAAKLTFWLLAFTSLGGLPCLDHFYVTLATPDGTVFDTVWSSCMYNTGGYAVGQFDLTAALQAHANQQVVLTFRGTAANLAGSPDFFSQWYVDDVSLLVY